MFIRSLRISNYKSFVQSNPIEFEPGVNLIVGENNVGKTALLEVLTRRWQNNPYIGKHATGSGESSAVVVFRFKADEVTNYADKNHDQVFMPALGSPPVEHELMELAINDHLDLHLRIIGDKGVRGPMFMVGRDGRERPVTSNAAMVFDLHRDHGAISSFNDGREQGGAKDYFTPQATRFADNILFIEARRVEVHTSSLTANQERHTPIAQNLAVKIQERYNEHIYKFQAEYLRLVNQVLPQIRNVLPLITGGNVTLKISPYEPDSPYGDVSYLLSESGTGVGQVLAMLYVVVYEQPSAIVIDEPNSFLHPRATRELLRIFRENTQHQYFITTHSPEVFAVVKPERYTALSYVDEQTVVSNLTYGDLAYTFRELGISPFFPYAVWVEGETEAEAFPLIVKNPDVRFFPLRSADEVADNRKRKEIDRIIGIYRKMTDATTGEPVPTEMKIVIDGEHLQPTDIEDLSRPAVKLVKFIPRKMFENYLLDAEAVATILNVETDSKIDVEEIQAKFDASRDGADENAWLQEVDGAKLLIDIFQEKTVPYKKTKHSVELTRWLLTNKPTTFTEIKAFLGSIFTDDSEA